MTPDANIREALLSRTRFRFLGLSLDDMIRCFFGGNALVAVVVLGLITLFLFKEGLEFFGQNRGNLQVYRLAGLEYVDHIRRQVEEHTALNRRLQALRLERFMELELAKNTPEEIAASLASFDEFSTQYGDAAEDVRGVQSDLTEAATAIKEKHQIYLDGVEQQQMLLKAGRSEEAGKVVTVPVDFKAETATLTGVFPTYQGANKLFAGKLEAAIAAANPERFDPALRGGIEKAKVAARSFIASFPGIEKNMQAWRYDEPIAWWKTASSFLWGRDWLTASFWQDYYGLIPLFVGSLFVSVIALVIAVPLGVAAAIYVSEVASIQEKTFIKPYVEFIAAIPSVVLGFFGIAVLGSALRFLSQQTWLGWVPGFPMAERLNAATAGCLLALMAIPTIFSLAEDAINNVPRHFKEASYALGANRWQTISRILIPASLSGIISAILLGFGRVIGETMVVLLCAGNRIAIPDFSAGLGTIFQPVHTMTGIIAQEMGEVVQGSIHYRALFMVGVVLFLLSLVINYTAQRIVRRYRISIG